jgi:hypothetical protein
MASRKNLKRVAKQSVWENVLVNGVWALSKIIDIDRKTTCIPHLYIDHYDRQIKKNAFCSAIGWEKAGRV